MSGISYVVNNISLPFDASFEEAFSVAKKRLNALGINAAGAKFSIYRRSVDARRKNDIRFVYSICADGIISSVGFERLQSKDVSVKIEAQTPIITFGTEPQVAPTVVAGAGPCGLFCALMLAENGFNPVLIEKGGSVFERKQQIEQFIRDRVLDERCNIQFGAGGAGTFSDGKLVTRINDPLSGYVFQKLVEFGAPKDILFVARPHIGTDILSKIIENVIDRIIHLGGSIMYHTELLGYKASGSMVTSILTNNGEIACGDLVLAIGHSARNTYEMLIHKGVSIEPKSFSVGMRIEHSAMAIDSALYGDYAGNQILGHAEYNLSHNTNKRGVYTFCMCPGGVVVAATSEKGGVVSNGMSYRARDGKNSNSAICCSIFKEDYGAKPLAAINFQRNIERAAFVSGGSDYSAPIITVGDFLNHKLSNMPTNVLPTYMDGNGVKLSSAENYLPLFVTENIRDGILAFDKKIEGFASATAILTGAETRTSAPVRILRDKVDMTAIRFSNLYPAGEGAGYAGGITSAAIDGVKTALAIMKKYKP